MQYVSKSCWFVEDYIKSILHDEFIGVAYTFHTGLCRDTC